MRRPNQQAEQSSTETIVVLNHTDPSQAPEIKLDAPGEAYVKADATEKNKPLPEGVEPPRARKFRVLADKMILDKHTRSRTPLRAGKIIDTNNYDIPELAKQGVRLQEVQPGEDEEIPQFQF